ncbi:MAG: hypothetical protein GY943_07090, partial [Chloroflexi bacterium]|nr:hypothetical protein [Chloroflexota bacterium]
PVAYAGLNHLDKWMVGAVVAVTAVSVFIIHPAGWIHDESTGIEVEPAKTQVFADFGGQITLLGHDSPNPTMQPGELFDVTVYWKLQQLQEINFQSYIHIIKPDGTLLTQSDHLNPGEFPTRRWPLDKYVRDTHFLQLPANTPPGEYDIVTGLWVQSEGWRLPLFDQSGSQIGDNFKLFTLTVTP